MAHHWHESGTLGTLEPRLTHQESRVLELIVEGECNPMIAAALGLGDRTVDTMVKNMLEKFKCKNRTQLAVWAVRNVVVFGKELA